MNIQFQRSSDFKLIAALLKEPRVYRRMANDSAPPAGEFQVGPVSGIDYIVAWYRGCPVALFLLCGKDTPGVAETHFVFVPAVWGTTRAIAEAFLEWVWRSTSLTRLIGPLPSYNKLALKLARSVGFVEQCVKSNAGIKNGKPFSLIVTEAVRPAVSKGEAA